MNAFVIAYSSNRLTPASIILLLRNLQNEASQMHWELWQFSIIYFHRGKKNILTLTASCYQLCYIWHSLWWSCKSKTFQTDSGILKRNSDIWKKGSESILPHRIVRYGFHMHTEVDKYTFRNYFCYWESYLCVPILTSQTSAWYWATFSDGIKDNLLLLKL